VTPEPLGQGRSWSVCADLGCGPAHDGARFARAGHRVTGVDRSAGMLAHAARALPGHVAPGDLRRLPLASQSIDGIWCCAALLHVPHDQTTAALREMRRVLSMTEEITSRHWLKILAGVA